MPVCGRRGVVGGVVGGVLGGVVGGVAGGVVGAAGVMACDASASVTTVPDVWPFAVTVAVSACSAPAPSAGRVPLQENCVPPANGPAQEWTPVLEWGVGRPVYPHADGVIGPGSRPGNRLRARVTRPWDTG